MKFYFVLQFRRMRREVRALGVMPVFAFALGTLGFILASVAFFRQIPATAAYIYPFAALGMCFLLAEKKRNDFLASTFSNIRFPAVRAIENAIISIPFSVFLAFRHEFLISVVTLVLCSAFSLFRPNRTITLHIPSPFSGRPYEFSTGFRRNYLLLLVLYLVSGIALKTHNYNLGIVLVPALSITAATFYSHLDPSFYVWIFAFSGKRFLSEKIKTCVIYGLMLLVPVALPLMLVYPEHIGLSLLMLAIAILIIVLAVLAAYVNFPSKMTMTHQIKFFVGIFFPPSLLLVIPDFYLRASERLKVYLKC